MNQSNKALREQLLYGRFMYVVPFINGFAFQYGHFKFLIGLDLAVLIIILVQIRNKL